MTADIHTLDVVTTLPLPSSRVIDAARAAIPDENEVVVIGYDADGEFFFASSRADGGDVLWLLEMAKAKLIDIARNPD